MKTGIRYFDFKRHWTKRVVPHLDDLEFNRVLIDDFNRYTFGRWGQEFKPGMLPVEPVDAWRIISSDKHSTVWDGDRTLFDMQFSALDIDPDECFRLALHEGIVLPIGEYMILGDCAQSQRSGMRR